MPLPSLPAADKTSAVSEGRQMDERPGIVVTGASGRMVALRDGTYTHIPMSTVTSGVKRVDVDELYDVDEYRPKVRHVLGKPMFLY